MEMRMPRLPAVFVLLASLILGCGTGTGPGSGADAIRFGVKRMAELKRQTTEQDEHGKWHTRATELRDATPGFSEKRTFGIAKVEAHLEYDYRILESGPHETKEEAEAATLEPDAAGWTKRKEVYVFEDGEWTPETQNIAEDAN